MYAVQCRSKSWVFKWIPCEWCGTVSYAVQGVLTFKSVDETGLVCDHSIESYWAVLSCGTVYYAVQGGSNF